jgi:hypothetical protein
VACPHHPHSHSSQVEYAACITQLASTAQAFLEQLQRRRLQQSVGSTGSGGAGGSSFITGSSGGGALPLNFDEEVRPAAGPAMMLHCRVPGCLLCISVFA